MVERPAPLVAVINTGSTSTKVALFRGHDIVSDETVRHSVDELNAFRRLIDQVPMRESAVLDVLERCDVALTDLDAVSCRGGLLAPLPSGTYRVDDAMLDDLRSGRYGLHASNLSAVIGARIAEQAEVPAFIVDPVVVDELCPEARYSGIPEIERRSIWHALNQKAVARRIARKLGKRYEEADLIVAHLGGGTSIAAHRRGKVIDVNNALDGDGPFAVERSGGLPAADLVRLAREMPPDELLARITGRGGVVAYLGTNDLLDVENRAAAGDETAKDILAAMAYQVACEIGARAAALAGRVDAIALTGSVARCKPVVRGIKRRVQFIAPVHTIPGAIEMVALAEGALRVLAGEARAKRYRSPG